MESELKLIKGAKHAWPLKTDKFDLRPDVVAFFDRHVKGKPERTGKSELKKSSDAKPAARKISKLKQGQRPNVLFIAIDDLNDWQGALKGHPQVKTPNMDRLFRQGVLFTNAHCSQAVCTASRNLSLIHI